MWGHAAVDDDLIHCVCVCSEFRIISRAEHKTRGEGHLRSVHTPTRLKPSSRQSRIPLPSAAAGGVPAPHPRIPVARRVRVQTTATRLGSRACPSQSSAPAARALWLRKARRRGGLCRRRRGLLQGLFCHDRGCHAGCYWWELWPVTTGQGWACADR